MSTKEWISLIFFRALEILFVLCFLLVLKWVIFKEVPQGNKDLINIMLGVLSTVIVGIANYEWGSSRGSERKTDIIAETDTLKAEKEPNKTNAN